MALEPMHLEATYSIANHHVMPLRTRQSGPVSGTRKRIYCTTRMYCPSACVLHWRLVHPNNPTLNRSVPLGSGVRLKYAVRLLQHQLFDNIGHSLANG